MSINIPGPYVAILVGVSGFIMALAQIRRRTDATVAERIRDFDSSHGSRRSDQTTSQRVHGHWAVRLVTSLLPQARYLEGLRKELIHAGHDSPLAVPVYLGVQLVLPVVVVVLVISAGRMTSHPGSDLLLHGGITASVAFLLPRFWLRRRKLNRLRTLNRSVPDLLDLVVSCLDAGLSLDAVIQRISREPNFAHPLLAAELARVQREIDLGAPADRALESFADRTNSDVIRSVAAVAFQARKFGTQMSSALRTHADILRDQREQQAEEAAQKAAVKILFPTLLFLFPITFVVVAGPAAIQISENLSAGSSANAQLDE